MAKIKGLCRNEACELCDQIQEAEKLNFVCEKCGKELIPFGSGAANPNKEKKKKVILLTSAVAIVCCIIAFFIFYSPSSTPTSPPDDTKGEGKTDIVNVEKLFFKETVQDMQLKAGEEIQLNIEYVPANANEDIKWRSEDINIATVSDKGLVKAVSSGSTNITAVTNRTGISASINISIITEKNVEKPVVKPAAGTLDLGYATYEGDSKNGKPEGNGTMTFKKKYVVPGSKGDIEAQPGEYAIGRWHNGQVNVVTLYQKDGNQVTILHKLTGGAK